MKKFLPAIGLLFLYACSSPQGKTSNTDSSSTDSVKTDTTTKPDTSANKTAGTNEEGSKWEYSEKADKMTSKKKYYASIDANELLQFDFPYDGGSTATLTVRHQDGENEALLTVSKGQFITGVDGTTVKVRVDDGPATTYSANGPSDGSTEVLFIENANKLIKKLKSAKKLLVQAEFYDSGNKVMEFNVAGFQWAH